MCRNALPLLLLAFFYFCLSSTAASFPFNLGTTV